MTHPSTRYAACMAILLLSVIAGCATATPVPDGTTTETFGSHAVVILPQRDDRETALWKPGMSGITAALGDEGINSISLADALTDARRTTTGTTCTSSEISCQMLMASYAGYQKAIALEIQSPVDEGVQGAILVFDAGYCVTITTFVVPQKQIDTFGNRAREVMTDILKTHALSPQPPPRGLEPLHTAK